MRSVSVHQFSMVPRADIPRAAFNMEFTHKTTFDAGYLVPIMCEEVLPGDSWNVSMTAFARLATPIFPLMDNLHIDTFFFFVPNRLVWNNWVKFMGQQESPGDSISYVIPQVVSPAGGFPVGSTYDYLGLPTVGQVGGGNTVSVSALPLRGYFRIYHEWFRDQNLINAVNTLQGDGPDTSSFYDLLRRRAKRPDYFTTALPYPQRGGTPVTLPLGTSAPVKTSASNQVSGVQVAAGWLRSDGTAITGGRTLATSSTGSAIGETSTAGTVVAGGSMYPSNLYADLSAATAATINQLRQAFQIQKLLERDARGGTRYAEIVQSHFGVRSPDARLQRPEYLGGSSTPMQLTPIAQQSATGLTGGSTPIGTLSAMGTGVSRNGFSTSFVEHGYVFCLVNVRADLTYQQGIRRHWSRQTRYDYYWPAFAMLGEQDIKSKEIYADGSTADNDVFGYQERWAEYRYCPGMVTGLFRSTSAGTLDGWHLAQRFTSRPTLGATFINDTPPLSRVLAVGSGANGAQIIFDSLFRIRAVRPVPLFSVPGQIDRF